jgi:hypothetical protein
MKNYFLCHNKKMRNVMFEQFANNIASIVGLAMLSGQM